MKKYKQFFRAAGLVAFCLITLFACKKENKDIVYSQRPASKNLFLSISGTGNLNHTQKIVVQSTASGNAAVGLNLTLPSSTDITATVDVDTAKVKTYNAANNTQFYLLPAASYTLQAPANGLTIKAGNLFSADSVKISFKNLAGLRATNYLLPVSITKVSGSTSAILSDSVKTVYININLPDIIQTTVNLTTDAGTTKALTYPVGVTGAAAVIPVTIQIAPVSPNNITVTPTVDNSLVGSGLTAFPDGSYSISASSVTVAAGQASATFNISIPDLSKFDGTKAYLLPVTISKLAGDDFALKGDKNTVYVKLSFNNLNNANNTSATGTKLLTKSGWNATASSSFDGTPFGGANYPPSNAIDGNNSTDWVSDYFKFGSNENITIDMGASIAVKTISYNKAYSNILLAYNISTYPSYVNIYSSTNGTDWVSQGQYQPVADTGGSISSPIVNYINFFNAIQARYIRLEVVTPGGLSEINVYQ